VNTSTAKVKVRSSAGCSAPTPTTWRVISSPRSLRTESITEYSQGRSAGGCRIVPSTRSAEKLVGAFRLAPGSKRKWCRQAGQTLALSRIVALQ
jgi:hypothetical protein